MTTMGLRTSRSKLVAAVLVLHKETDIYLCNSEFLDKIQSNLVSHSGRFLSQLKSSSFAEEGVQLLILGVYWCHSFYLHWEDALLVVNPSEENIGYSDICIKRCWDSTGIQSILVELCLLLCRRNLETSKVSSGVLAQMNWLAASEDQLSSSFS